MFCNHCGANLPEGAAHCTMCGAPMTQNAPVQPNYDYSQQPQSPAPAPAKKSSLPTTITCLISVVLIIASIIAPLAMPLFDVPVMSLALDAADEDFDEQLDEMKDEWKDSEEEREMAMDELSSKEKKAYKKLEKQMEKTLDHFSLLNVNELAKQAKDAEDAFEMDGINEEDYEEFSQIMGVIAGVSVGAFVLPLLFALLGGLKKSAGLTIAAMIFTAISQLILSGFVLLLLSAVVYIVQIVLCKKYKA